TVRDGEVGNNHTSNAGDRIMLTNASRFARTATLLCAAIVTALPLTSAQACNRGGYWYGGTGFGYGYCYSRPAYVVPAYSAVSYPVVQTSAAQTQPTTLALVTHAKKMLKARNFAEAQQAVSVALQREPKNSQLMQLKALIAFAQNDFQTAAK